MQSSAMSASGLTSEPLVPIFCSKCRSALAKCRLRKAFLPGVLALTCLSQASPAHAEYESTVEYLRPKITALIQRAASQGKIPNSGVSLSELRQCSNVAVTGLATWSDGEEPKGRPFYIWFPNGVNVICWEYFKTVLPTKPFELVEGIEKSRIKKIDFNPFSDPGPSIFFFFER